ncbi:MAG: hypothetical protein QM778_26880 [Myxococcales bacterium]
MRKLLTGTLMIAGLTAGVSANGLAQDTMNPSPQPTAPTQPATPSPSTPAVPGATSKVAPPPALTKVSIEVRGRVSDVWEAEVRNKDKENKVVLIETDQGQVVLADLGPSETTKVEEGTPATVMGEMRSVEGTQRFVPATVKVGAKATGPAPANAQVKAASLGATKQPQRQHISGKVVDKEKMNAKETHIDHELAVIDVDGSRMLVDLGPVDQLKAFDVDEGDHLNVDGQKIQVNNSYLLVAEKVQKGDKKVQIQREAMPAGKASIKTQGLGPVPQNAPVGDTPLRPME